MVPKAVNNNYVFVLHNVFMGCMGPLMKGIMNDMMARYILITVEYIKIKKNIFNNPCTSHSRLKCYSSSSMKEYYMPGGEHTVHAGTNSKNGTSYRKFVLNIHIWMQKLA